MFEYKVSLDSKPTPIREVLKSQGISLTLWRKIKQHGTILINDSPTNHYSLIQPGDKITLLWENTTKITPCYYPINICYEDNEVIVINKPSDMLVHPTVNQDHDTLANAVVSYYKSQNYSLGFHPIHRLDRNTSGLVLIAKYPHIQHILSSNTFKAVNRYYISLVEGIPEELSGVIDAPIGRCTDSIIKRQVCGSGQSAITNYKVINIIGNYSLLELQLLTGRTHQIRVHLSYIGNPIIGDDLYGGSTELLDRQALHAYKIVFLHPLTKKPITVTCELPPDLQNLILKLK